MFTIGRRASVQFVGERGFPFRLVAVDQRPTSHGWVWLTGYELNRRGEAVAKREIFVQLSGLQYGRAGVPANRSSRFPVRQ
ncbi:hypothetical protein E1166_14035 [Micromonospora sp. KC213]|nr:hypothetical protein [Micromonospora sp. KC213]TDC40823.1 hypothetical protein E1166_14035 [Micromonospora sp. KC213]